MASFLSALGISAPDPSAYNNIKLENSNLSEATNEMKSTVSSIDLVLSGADLVGLSPSYTDSIKSLRDQANTALNSNMSSAQLAAKNKEIADKLKASKIQQLQQRQADLIAGITAAKDKISARVAEINADKSSSPEIKAKFKELLDTANKTLTVVKAKKINTEGFQTSGTTPTPDVPEPPVLTSDELMNMLEELNTLKETEENKTFNWQRFGNKVIRYSMFFLFYISTITGSLLGGIILSNVYAEDYFSAIKIFYFIYGAIFFPLSLLYGAIKPPLWHAKIAPLESLVPREVPKITPPQRPVTLSPALASMTAAAAGTSAIRNLFRMGGGAEETAAEETAPEETPPSTPVNYGMFGFILPAEGETPTEEQLSKQKLLRILSITELVILTTVGIYYGEFSFLTSFTR